jgi:hypothetical protein
MNGTEQEDDKTGKTGRLASSSRFVLFLFVTCLSCRGARDTTTRAGDNGGSPPDPSTLEGQGWQYVQDRKCPDCHQSPNARDGTLSGQTSPLEDTLAYGANLTPDPDTGLDWQWVDGGVAAALDSGMWNDGTFLLAMQQGLDPTGVPFCMPMPRFADMSGGEAVAIAAYLRSLPPVFHLVPDSTCPPLKPPPDAGAPDSSGGAPADSPGGAPADALGG